MFMATKTVYDFASKESLYSTFSLPSLLFSLKDAYEASQTTLDFNPSLSSWYLDDMATIQNEINRREGV